jgi:hypothetical protein
VSLHRGIDGPAPLEPEPVNGPPGLHEERLTRRSTRLASGTLACPSCDAPVATPAAPLGVADGMACGWCGHDAAVRDFLTLSEPTRPTRVVVHVRGAARPGGLRRR